MNGIERMDAPEMVGGGRIEAGADRDAGQALRRGLACRCPRCGEGRIFSSYLKVADECGSCGLELSLQRADDGPAYVVMLVVLHVVGFAIPIFWSAFQAAPVLSSGVLMVAATAAALGALQPVKGAFIGLQWAKRMHGF